VATVTSAGSLAGQVTGSLASTASLACDLGRWLAIVVLLATFAVASLLTLAAVAQRVREFGTPQSAGLAQLADRRSGTRSWASSAVPPADRRNRAYNCPRR
jgi:hypothetical protein